MGGRPVPGSPGDQACAGHLRMGKPHTYVASISSPPPHLGLCPAVKHDWAFQDRDTQFYRFPGPEPEPVGVHELEEELVEALALLSQRGPDALLTVALRKP